MASASINVQSEELHLHVKKPATAMDSGPQARCRMCTANGKSKKDTRWICDKCPKTTGLCSRQCFDSWHTNHGFEVLSAARRVTIESAPVEPVQGGPQVIQEHDRELLSAADWAQKQEQMHTLCIKPPTKKRKDPYLQCRECKPKRVERRTICKACKPQMGFCSIECLRKHHFREGIFTSSSQVDDQESIQDASSQATQSDQNVAGPSSEPQLATAPQIDQESALPVQEITPPSATTSPLHDYNAFVPPLPSPQGSGKSFAFSSTPMNLSNNWINEDTSDDRRPTTPVGPHTPEGPYPAVSPISAVQESTTPPVSPLNIQRRTSRKLRTPTKAQTFTSTSTKPPASPPNIQRRTSKARPSTSTSTKPPASPPYIQRRTSKAQTSTSTSTKPSTSTSRSRKRPRQHSPEDTVKRVTRSETARKTKDGYYEALDEECSSFHSSEEET